MTKSASIFSPTVPIKTRKLTCTGMVNGPSKNAHLTESSPHSRVLVIMNFLGQLVRVDVSVWNLTCPRQI